jgi:oligoendopeptidase F
MSTVAVLGAPTELPRWDLTALFPGLDTPEFARGFDRLMGDFETLQRLFDDAGIGSEGEASDDDSLARRFEEALTALNEVAERSHSMASYLYGQVTADSRNELAQARFSELQTREVALEKLETRFMAWVGTLPVERLIETLPIAGAHAYPLRQLHEAAGHLMSEREESLAAELNPASGTAWSKLHGNLTSQIMVELDIDGTTRSLPMSENRNLAMHPRREVRRRAWEAELKAWEANSLPIAAALNGVKGQVLTLAARRGWVDPLDEALFWSGIDRQTLEALLGAARESLPDFRRYLRLKARALGVEELAWYDLFAPVGEASRSWTWLDAANFIETHFATFSGRLAGLARRAFAENWIDAGPRPGKIGGAYCMWLLDDQSRILANYSASYDGVSTLAHELGHAYHNLNQAGLTPLQRRDPMILAETASTFCETLVKEAALVGALAEEQRYILEQSLQGACQVVVDIVSRYDFETALFAARREREVSVRELREMMLAAQRETYGGGLADDSRHPYMWAVKGHYYRTDSSFYNFPYLFGLLFGLGLFAEYRRAPEAFQERYDRLLATTGLASAVDLAAEFGIDVRSRDFWQSSLDMIRDDIDRFAELVER